MDNTDTGSARPEGGDDRFLTINEVAVMAGIHRASVYRAMANGSLPYSVVRGHNRRIRLSDVVKFIEPVPVVVS